MALVKSSLSQALESVFGNKPSSAADAATAWADAYVGYASAAMTSVSSLPTTAQANKGILVGAFTSAFNAQDSNAAAAAITQGVIGFWQAMVWVGAGFSGVTSVPGNVSLTTELAAIFSDVSEKSDAEKASELAGAFESGAKAVVVVDTNLASGAPVAGPIN